MFKLIPTSLLGVLALASTATAQGFSYPDFSSVAGLVLNNDAVQAGTSLRVSGASISEKGSAYYGQAVSVAGGFETTFTFEITLPAAGGGDGLTFIVQNAAAGTAALGRHASAIGYAQFTGEVGFAIENSLVVEIDTYKGGGDLSGNEISVHTNGTGENDRDEAFSLGQVSPLINMSDGLVHTMRISYAAGQLDVYLDDLVTPELTVAYDFGTGGTWIGGGAVGGLSLIGGTSAYVGFTASAGGAWENHDLLSWEFSAGGPGTGYCFGDAGSGTPCPCGNDNDGSVPGSGCANGVFASGALLTGSGEASLSADTLVLATSGLEPNNSGLYFQADNNLSPGNIWGDGLQCAGGQLRRLGVRFSDASGYSDTSGYPLPISVKAGNILAGDTKYYQCWYRNPAASPCGTDFNASNGYAVTWAL